MVYEYEVKCPYHNDWILMTAHDFHCHNIHECPDCHAVFRLDDTVVIKS